MRDLLADLQYYLSIDLHRIYINGMSNSGTMTARLASEMPHILPLLVSSQDHRWILRAVSALLAPFR